MEVIVHIREGVELVVNLSAFKRICIFGLIRLYGIRCILLKHIADRLNVSGFLRLFEKRSVIVTHDIRELAGSEHYVHLVLVRVCGNICRECNFEVDVEFFFDES